MSGLAFADPGPAPPSNTGDISGGIFKEANDLYLSTTDFGDLMSNALFLQFDMPSGSLGGQGFEIGGTSDVFGMYMAAYLNAVVEGTNGQLGGGDSQTTAIDQDFIVAGNVITGKTESRLVEVDYDVDSMLDFQALVGIGDMGIGIGAMHMANNGYGSYQANHNYDGNADWDATTVGTGSAAATNFSTFDAAGALVSTSAEQYGLGEDLNQALDITASFGMPLSLSETLALEVGADVLVGFRNLSELAMMDSYVRVVGSGTAISYTPAATVDGSDPVAIADLTSYSYETAMEANKYTLIEPSLFGYVTMPVNEMVTGTAGLMYTPSLSLYSAKYTDNAGAAQKVSGLADTYSSVDISTAVNPNDFTLTETTTTSVDVWETEAISGMTNTVGLEFGIEVVPSERFRFGVMYSPTIVIGSSTSFFSGQEMQTEITDNGDGVDGVDDEVIRTTVDWGGYSESTKSFEIRNRVNTAAQFFLIPERLRVNLGAQVDNTMIDRVITEIVTNGTITLNEETATDTTDTAATTFVNTNYTFNADVRDDPDDEQTVNQAGSSALMYDAGLTFFFDENMFLDLRMDATGGDIWNTGEWSLEMTILY
jgi:hypothetical protein